MRRAPEAPNPWRNRFSRKGVRKPLIEILETLKPKPDAEAEERGATANGATGNHKPLSEILEALKSEALPEPSFKRRAW